MICRLGPGDAKSGSARSEGVRALVIRRSLTAKIGLSIMAIIFIVSGVQYLALGPLLRQTFFSQSGQRLLAAGEQYAQMAGMAGPMMMQTFSQTADAKTVIMDRSGSIQESSQGFKPGAPLAADKTVFRDALRGRPQVLEGTSGLFGATGILVGVPIADGGKSIGAVLMFQPGTIVDSTFRRIEWLLVAAASGGILVALLLTVVVSRRIANPLLLMVDASNRMGRGEYTARVPVIGEDEVARLGMAMNDLASNLARLETSRREFLADISHELRTPMSYIRGYSQVLIEGMAKSEEDVTAHLQVIHDETMRLESLVEALFSAAKSDEPKLTMNREPTALADVAQGVVDKLRGRCFEKGIELRTRFSYPDVVLLDRAQIEEVFINLLDNALRYTPTGGSVEIAIFPCDEGIKASVSDTGCGIGKDDLPRIFDRLYRVEKSRSRSSGGAGLGLAIVKRIVEAHGGSVEAASELGVGTTITFVLPKAPDTALTTAE